MSSHKPLFAFFGTPIMAVYVLDALEARGLLPALVVCTPDKPKGRGLELTPTPAKEWALARGIDVITPVSLKDLSAMPELTNTDWDIFVVAAYGKLIPKLVLDIPRRGCLNVHPSLLPKFRGPSPVVSAILADEHTTGVSVMLMDEQMDHGPVVAQGRIEFAPEDWPQRASVLTELLFTEGANLLAEVLPQWLAGEVTPVVQDELQVSLTKKFTPEDALVNPLGDAHQELLKIRAFDLGPRPYCFATLQNGQEARVVITDAEIQDGKLVLLKVIPEGKKEMAFEEFLRNGAKIH